MFSLASSISLGLALLPFASASIIDVQVGGASLAFNPQAISAQPGDQVVFHFQAKNHTATQSSFASPCGRKDGGIDSGFMPVPANQTDNFPTWTVTVNDTNPVWIYCAQGANTPASHCGQGMVFAINCGQDGSPNSFTNFKNAALGIGASLSAAAAASSTAPPAAPPATDTATAAYGGITIPPAPSPVPVTETITLEASTWTTTYASFPNSPAATPASLAGTVHTVIVGGPGNLTFNPPHIAAQPRDTIVFQFQQKNHSVVQSSFADPCRPLAAGGFLSNFFPVGANDTDFPTWNITINDTAPVWAYCRQKTPASHCGAGMVFAVNSDESSARSFSAFQQLAEQLNGTTASPSGSGSAASPSTTSGAISLRIGTATVSLVVAALVASVY